MARPSFVSNPPWVSSVIADSYETLEDTIPAAWLPRLADIGARGARLDAAVVEYGCGVYGCVVPTVDPKVVLKLTTDTTEAEFAAEFASNLAAPICVTYHMVIKTRAKHDGNRVYLLWRDSAEHVGKMSDVLGKEAVAYINRQHAAAQRAFEAAHKHPENLARFVGDWQRTCAAMARQDAFPDLKPLAAGLVKVWEEQRIIFGDIHAGNLGVVDGRWVITDPGNIAVVEDFKDMLPPDHTGHPGHDVILKAERTGRPSQNKFIVSGVHVPFTGEVLAHAEVLELLLDAMPAGFSPGLHLDDWRDFAVVRGVPERDHVNTVFITTPSDLVDYQVFAEDLDSDMMDVVSRAWADAQTVPAITVRIPPQGGIYVSSGNEALQLAANTNRPVAVVVEGITPGWSPAPSMKNVSRRIADALPDSIRRNTRPSI